MVVFLVVSVDDDGDTDDHLPHRQCSGEREKGNHFDRHDSHAQFKQDVNPERKKLSTDCQLGKKVLKLIVQMIPV